MNYHTFVDWADAERWAIRRANRSRCLVGIRWNDIGTVAGNYSLHIVTQYERHERQWVTVIEPGTPHAYTMDFIGPFEHSA